MYAVLAAIEGGYAINVHTKNHTHKYGMVIRSITSGRQTIAFLQDLRIKNVEIVGDMNHYMIDDMRDANLVLWASMQSKVQY